MQYAIHVVSGLHITNDNRPELIRHIILAYPTEISVNPTGARKCRLTRECKTTLVHDVSVSFRHTSVFDVIFCQTFRRQRRK